MLGNAEKRLNTRLPLKEKSVKHIRIVDTKNLYEVYDFKEEIGHGSYGTVICALEKQTNKNYAIKIVNKFMTGANQLQEVYSEITILKRVEHPNIIYLEKIYESPRKIYLVLELCTTNLSIVYQKERSFSEKTTKKIIKQLVNAVYYLHKHDIVHRDIKLENILVTNNPIDPYDKYFIKLTDFGLSIVKTGAGIEDMIKQYCGTVQYMAPEILLQRSYSELCDVWAIGVMLYMFIYGEFPFTSNSEEELTNQIINAPLEFKEPVVQVGYEVVDLLKSLLEKDPASRITALEVLQHPWVVDSKVNMKKDNVLEYMKKWKNEMKKSSGGEEDFDWMGLCNVNSMDTTSIMFKSERKEEPRQACLIANKRTLHK